MAGEIESLVSRVLTYLVGHDAAGLTSRQPLEEALASPIIALTGNITLTAADAGKIFMNDTTSNWTVTVPNNLPVKFAAAIVAWNTGTVTLAGGALNRSGVTVTGARYRMISFQVMKNAGGTAAEYIAGEM